MNKIIITTSRGEEGEGFSAHVEGIACAGTGATKEEAVHALANVLADFVKGHAGTITHMRMQLREHAGKLSELADP